jgi:hypothetical protein
MHQARNSIKQSIMKAKTVSGRSRAPEKAPKSAGRMIGNIVVSGLFCILSLAVIGALAFFCFFN